MAGTKLSRHVDGTSDVDSGRPAQTNPFQLVQLKNDLECFGVADPVCPVHDDVFQILRDPALTDSFCDGIAFGLQLAVIIIGKHLDPYGSATPI